MRAATFPTSGPDMGVLSVGPVPDAEPGPGEVRVRIAVAGVNPTDPKARAAGRLPGVGDTGTWAWPRQIPGQDGAGVIDAVGADVPRTRLGERVWLHHAGYARPGGSAAELCCVPSTQAAPLHGDVGFDQGAGLGIPFMTAHRCLFADGPLTDRDTVLVTGGAGAVGHATIQLAARAGAQVVATVSTDEKAAIASDAGAHDVIRYADTDAAEQIAAAAPAGLVRVVDVDVAANIGSYERALAPGAVVSVYAATPDAQLAAPVRQLMTHNAVLRFVLVYAVARTALDRAVADITTAVASGELVALPPRRFTLDDIAAAHEAVTDGTPGKVLLDVADLG